MAATATTAAAAARDPIEITCGELRTGALFPIEIARNAKVHALQQAIFRARGHADKYGVVVASDLKLFLARGHETQWLVASDAFVAQLEDGSALDAKYKRMLPMRRLSHAEYFGEAFASNEDEEQVHVLVQLPDENPSPLKRARLEECTPEEYINSLVWDYADGEFPPLPWSELNKFVTIPPRYLEGSGVVPPKADKPLILYTRDGFRKEWTEIQQVSVELPGNLYIVGAPGAGKSCAAYAFACCRVDRNEWTVVWIHMSQLRGRIYLVLFQGDRKAIASFKDDHPEKVILATLNALEGTSKKLLVFLDGFVSTVSRWECIRLELTDWKADAPTKRRLVCVTSQGTMAKWNGSVLGGQVGIRQRRAVCENSPRTVPSWTLEEYMKAIEDKTFVESVKDNLRAQKEGTIAPETTSVKELVLAKYFYVGGSARHMFCASTAEAVEVVQTALKRVSNNQDVLNATQGVYSATLVHSLIAHFERSDEETRSKCQIVSLYAAREIAAKVGPDCLQAFRDNMFSFNPALDGWLLETWFFVALAARGVKYYRVNESTHRTNKSKSEVWKANEVHYFDPDSDNFHLEPGWNAPMRWNQAGYDAVFWETQSTTGTPQVKHRLVFVQITRGVEHTYNPDPFQSLLKKFAELVDRDYEANLLLRRTRQPRRLYCAELYYVVPVERLEGSDANSKFTAPTSSEAFKRDVVAKVGTVWTKAESHVCTVGVEYAMQKKDFQARYTSQAPAHAAAEEDYSASIQAARGTKSCGSRRPRKKRDQPPTSV